MIKLDVSLESIVIVCSACQWLGLESDRRSAWIKGLAHIRAVHPDDSPGLQAAKRSATNHRRDK